jgi:hypothetical protein
MLLEFELVEQAASQHMRRWPLVGVLLRLILGFGMLKNLIDASTSNYPIPCPTHDPSLQYRKDVEVASSIQATVYRRRPRPRHAAIQKDISFWNQAIV